jgi:hypothetical protein
MVAVLRCRYEDNIELDLKEIWEVVDWLNQAQERDMLQAFVNTEFNFWVAD